MRFGGLSASEAGRRSAIAKRARRAAREADAEATKLTTRQRIGVALHAELTVEDWRKVISAARDGGKVADLARLADQAFGKAQAEEASHVEDELRTLTRGERSAMIASLLEEQRAQKEPALDEEDPRGEV